MTQHMVLTMLGPILLVLGAPATLALRALKPFTTTASEDLANGWCGSCTVPSPES